MTKNEQELAARAKWCRRLARELGGSLQIAAVNGAAAGAVVTLRLPVDR